MELEEYIKDGFDDSAHDIFSRKYVAKKQEWDAFIGGISSWCC